MTELDRHIRARLEQRFGAHQSGQILSIVERMRISDDAFKTASAVHKSLLGILARGGERAALERAALEGDIHVPVSLRMKHPDDGHDAERIHQEPVSRILAVTLATTAKFASLLHAHKLVDSDLALTRDDLMKDFIEAMSQVRDGAVPETVASCPPLAGALGAIAIRSINSVEDARLVEQMETGIDLTMLPNNGDFFVPVSEDEQVQMSHIVEGMLQRYADLSARKRLDIIKNAEMWRTWLDRLEFATPGDKASIRDTYRSVVIPAGHLLNLVSQVPAVKQNALNIIQNGGFLNREPDDSEHTAMLERGAVVVLRDHGQENTPTIAHIGILTDPEDVKQRLHHLFGYDPTVDYSDPSVEIATHVTTPVGQLQWFNPKYVRAMFANPELCACTIELAVNKVAPSGGAPMVDAGLATALKYKAFTAPKVAEKAMVLTMYYEVIEVNGQSVPSAMNLSSRGLIESVTQGKQIGILQQDFTIRSDRGQQIALKANWHIVLEQRDAAVHSIDSRRRLKA